MYNANPFRQPGQWYRGNTHSHSTESDGQLSMSDRFAAYREAGYDFLVLTDHRKVNDVSAYSTSDFLAISGSEVHPENPYGVRYITLWLLIFMRQSIARRCIQTQCLMRLGRRAVKLFYVIPIGLGTPLQIICHCAVISPLRSTTTAVWTSAKRFQNKRGTIYWIEADPFLASLPMIRTGLTTIASTDGLWSKQRC